MVSWIRPKVLTLLHPEGWNVPFHPLSWTRKVGCVFPMAMVSLPPHAEFGLNDHREYALHFTSFRFWGLTFHLVFKYGDKDIQKLQIHCDVTDKIGDVIEKFHEKHGKKYSKVIFDGDVIPTADYKKTLSELDIDDQDCLEVREWKKSLTARFTWHATRSCRSNRFTVIICIPVFSSIQPPGISVRGYLNLQKYARGEFPGYVKFLYHPKYAVLSSILTV